MRIKVPKREDIGSNFTLNKFTLKFWKAMLMLKIFFEIQYSLLFLVSIPPYI